MVARAAKNRSNQPTRAAKNQPLTAKCCCQPADKKDAPVNRFETRSCQMKEKMMNKQQFLNALEDILELEQNTLSGQEVLLDIEQWDSLAFLSVIAMADEHFDIVIQGDKLEKINTVNDLVSLVEEHFSA
jgi:acyl carrier protein